jgi:hypothetical protein
MNIRKSVREAVRVIVHKVHLDVRARDDQPRDPQRKYDDMMADSRRTLAKGR